MAADRLELRVLGPLDVLRNDTSVAPPGVRRRSLLAILLLEANDVVPVERLVDGIWGAAPPASAAAVVQTYVSLWRALLPPDRLVRHGRGYRVVVEPGELDLHRVSDLVAEGRAARAAHDPAAAEEALRAALALWRGEPLVDLTGAPFQADAARRLADQRRALLLEWADTAGAAGHPAAVVDTLRGELARGPLHEPVAEALARALYQAGDATGALEVLDRTRAALVDGLGVDPGPALAGLRLQVLRHDPGLRPDTPTAGSHHGNERIGRHLPVPADTFVGRDAELVEVGDLLRAHRLVTLVGPGGSGKTRLAVEVAAQHAAGFPGPVRFVDATPLTDAAELPDRVAASLPVHTAPGQTTVVALEAALQAHDTLLLLDNLEQVRGAAGVVNRLIRSAPRLRVLATSRAPLDVRGEHRYPVAPLSVEPPAAARERPGPAVRLFADRATAVDPLFRLDLDNVADVQALCHRLDGLPLPIELAARWAGVLAPDQLLAQMGSSLDLLCASGSDRPDRQQTLRATIDWSHDLVAEPARRVLRCCAVFRSGFSAEAAAAVCAEPVGAVLLALRELGEKGLLEVRRRGGEHSFALLATIREYAGEKLADSGDLAAAVARHAAYFVARAERLGRELRSPGQTAAAEALEIDRDDIDAALRETADAGDADRALSVAAGLWRYWQLRSHLDEGRRLVEDLAGRAHGARVPPSQRTGAEVDLALGGIAYWQLAYRESLGHYTRAAATYHELGDPAGLAEATYDMGFAAHLLGDHEAGQQLLEDALAQYTALGDEIGRAEATSALGFGLLTLGRLPEAAATVRAALETLREQGDSFAVANSLGLLGTVLSRAGRPEEARSLLREALARHASGKDWSGAAWALLELASIAVASGDARRGVLMAAAAETLEPTRHGAVSRDVIAVHDVRAEAAARLPAEELERLWAAGRRTPLEEAVRAAFEDDGPAT